MVLFILSILFRASLSLLPESFTRVHNFPEFNFSIWIHLIITPPLYFIVNELHKKIEHTHKATKAMDVAIVAISLYVILRGMASSFIVTYIPSDNLVGFMIALTIMSIICVYEQGEAIFITLVTGTLFTLLLISLSSSRTEILYNELICIILLTGFFFISRYNYIYKANHFLQLVEINKKNIEIARASNFKTEVLGMVAHDLRNPIAAIESVAMLMEMDTADADTLENIHLVKQSCEKAKSIINDLLESARNDSNADFAVKGIEMNGFLKNLTVLWNQTPNIPNHIIFKAAPEPAFADINPEKFQRVIDNLISNAAKFSKDSDAIEIALSIESSKLKIEVTDYGVGIPNEILPNIFDRFSKAGRSGLRGEHSTGLGLSIVKQIVELHNGEIEVKSTVGQGSTFVIHLPESANQSPQ